MLFSSSVFLICFLPFVLFVYYVLLKWNRNLQNVFLLFSSLGFYAWGEPKFIIILLISIILNWFLAIIIDNKRKNINFAKFIIGIDVILNLSIMYYFKYWIFTISNINYIFSKNLNIPDIALPIGISFFTFQAISYVIDVYRGNGQVQKNPLNVGLYIAFFPQLIAGPIVRYKTISEQIIYRKETFAKFSEGVIRFIIGLSKKIILANNFALLANFVFYYKQGSEISCAVAWIGAIAYTLQIYFDFSGYSDMAIGLGKMFGFDFEENFNYPYISKSTSEFWRRWHISLGKWFKDYVYIPLGGNKSRNKVYFNLFIVWLLTGIWHGANWTFIIWGLLYFISISIEKLINFEHNNLNKYIKHIYTMTLVIIGWVIFRADTINDALYYIKNMFLMNGNRFIDSNFLYLIKENLFFLIIGIIFALPIRLQIKNKFIYDLIYILSIIIALIISMSYLIKGTYNPFIYFNF